MFRNYKIDTIFVMFAIVFILLAMIENNFAFIGGAVMCLIFGFKKLDSHYNQDKTTNKDETL